MALLAFSTPVRAALPETLAWLALTQQRLEHPRVPADPRERAALLSLRTALRRRLPRITATTAVPCGAPCTDPALVPTPSPLLLAGEAVTRAPVYLLAARGRLLSGYGEPVGEGARTRGILLATAPGAPVVAPAAGRLLYADGFRGYGQVMIIDHGHGWATLLAGVRRPLRQAGDAVLMGEPVARAGDRLTVELHHGARTVDVVAMIAATG